MEVTFAKEYSAILKDLLHYLGYTDNKNLNFVELLICLFDKKIE